jgi:hemerythrin-like metal-binding protein
MEWKEEYSVGIKEIDTQHKELISLFSRITDSVEQELQWSEVHYRIVELRNFASFHFDFEEALLRLYGCPEADGHVEFHKQFFAKLNDIEKRSLLDEVKQEMFKFLFDWLFGHILTTDKAYAKYILSGAKVVAA